MKTTFWLVREWGIEARKCWYQLFYDKPIKVDGDWSEGRFVDEDSPRKWRKFSDIRLRPGGGPVQITIDIREAK